MIRCNARVAGATLATGLLLMLAAPGATRAADEASADTAERLEALREAIREERAALEQERERQQALEARLEAVRDELEATRSRERRLERETGGGTSD